MVTKITTMGDYLYTVFYTYSYFGNLTFQIIDIGDPTSPRVVGEHRKASQNFTYHIIRQIVQENFAFIIVNIENPAEEFMGVLLRYDCSTISEPKLVGNYTTTSSIIQSFVKKIPPIY